MLMNHTTGARVVAPKGLDRIFSGRMVFAKVTSNYDGDL